MKQVVTAIALVLLLTPEAFAREQAMLARVTVYWARGGSGSDRFTRQHKCATGMRLRQGHCAVDPRRIPYGSQVVFPDGTTLAAVDTGTAVMNRKAARKAGRTVFERNALVVDRFFETKRQALAWANTHSLFMAVRVVPANYQLPKRMVVRKALPVSNRLAASDSSTISNPIIASNSRPSRNPLNRLGR
jgi:3D (Asp-Asp-Asp) domain-containing protein